jgi:hypothetical protein
MNASNGSHAGSKSSSNAGLWYRGFERRAHRRHDLLSREVTVECVTEAAAPGKRAALKKAKSRPLGHLVDLSAGGIRVRAARADGKGLKLNAKVQVRVELPDFAGISPFIDRSGPHIRPKREWTGQMTVVRLTQIGDEYEIGGRLDDIDELDQGMLSLYLSTQPLAA